MNINFLEEQQMLRQAARDFLTQKCPRSLVRAMENDERGYSLEIWKDVARMGWTGLILPEKHGGSGMGFLELAILLEEMGRVCFPGPFFSTVLLGALPIIEAGSDRQKDRYLPFISSGKSILSFALTEVDGLYEAESLRTKAMAEGDGFILTGRKSFVPDAGVADLLLCAVRTGDAAKDVSILVIDTKSPGIRLTPLKTRSGVKLFEVTLDKVRVPGDNLLGRLNGGWEIVERTLEKAALARSCEMLGGMQQVLEMTVAYAKERRQFDRPIGSFQIIQHYCAAMVTDVEGARFGTYRAAWALSEGLHCRKEIAVARSFINDASHRVASLAHQVHGAIGITMDHDLQYYTRRFKAAATVFGDADFWRQAVAQEMGL